MNQKDKELLLADLCARLPYGVMLNIEYYNLQGDGKLKNRDVILSYGNIGYCSDNTNWVSVKPYLRPMSSMTEEECIELDNIEATIENISKVIPNIPYHIEVVSSKQIDWLNAHHFDYRGLIERGLALEAPKDMYKID